MTDKQANDITPDCTENRCSGEGKLPPDQPVDLIYRFVYFGWPTVPEYSGRGRPSKRTQYDISLDRRREPYRLLKKLPKFDFIHDPK